MCRIVIFDVIHAPCIKHWIFILGRKPSFSKGNQASRDPLACIRSIYELRKSLGCSHGTSDQPRNLVSILVEWKVTFENDLLHHSCSTFDLGCSHGKDVRNHRMRSRSGFLDGHHRIHHRIHLGYLHNLGFHRIHQPLGSCGRCGQSLSTAKEKQLAIYDKNCLSSTLPCNIVVHRHLRIRHRIRHHGQHPQLVGWSSPWRCVRTYRTRDYVNGLCNFSFEELKTYSVADLLLWSLWAITAQMTWV